MPRPTRPAAQPKPKQPSIKKPNGTGNNGASNDAVARRAYEIYQSRGGVHGSDLDHWLEAERELQSMSGSATAPAKPKKSKAPQVGA